MATPKLHIYYDPEGDYLEIRFGEPVHSTHHKIAPDFFARISDTTGETIGYSIFGVTKAVDRDPIEVDIPIPLKALKELLNG